MRACQGQIEDILHRNPVCSQVSTVFVTNVFCLLILFGFFENKAVIQVSTLCVDLKLFLFYFLIRLSYHCGSVRKVAPSCNCQAPLLQSILCNNQFNNCSILQYLGSGQNWHVGLTSWAFPTLYICFYRIEKFPSCW